MQINDYFVLIKSSDYFIPYDFYISKFPVTINLDKIPANLGSLNDFWLYKSTWLNATKFCNLVSERSGLPIAHDTETGNFIKSSGFRLPTPQEWEYAAKGWSGSRKGNYTEIQKQHYKVPGIDYPNTPKQILTYEDGYSKINELIPNELGIHGMLVYSKEWCCAREQYENHINQFIHWEEYILNYDNAIGYRTTTRNGANNDVHVFRIVLPSAS